jgi:hypothetical protein
MKALDWIRLLAALSLAAATSYLLLHAGYGAAGGWILGALFSTLLFSCAGGTNRVRFTAIAVVPPFLINRASELSADWSLRRNTRSPSETLHSMFPESLWITLLALGLFVAIPLTISLIASRLAHKIRNAPLDP